MVPPGTITKSGQRPGTGWPTVLRDGKNGHLPEFNQIKWAATTANNIVCCG